MSNFCSQTSDSSVDKLMLLDAAIESSQESCRARLGSQAQICFASAVQASSHPAEKLISPKKSVVISARLARSADGRRLSDVGTHVGRTAIIVCFTNSKTKCIDVNIFERNPPNAAGAEWTRTKRATEFSTVAIGPLVDTGCPTRYSTTLCVSCTGIPDFPTS